jgi:hypothetical protein
VLSFHERFDCPVTLEPRLANYIGASAEIVSAAATNRISVPAPIAIRG